MERNGSPPYSLAEEEKYWFIRIFCAGIDEEEFRGRILLEMSATNVSIDNQLVTLVLGVGWCRDLCTYFQQRDQDGCDPTIQATFAHLGSFQSFVSLMFQIYRLQPSDNDEDNTPSNGVDGLNSVALSIRKKVTSYSKISFYSTKLGSHQK